MCIRSILLSKSNLKWCKHLSKSLFLYFNYFLSVTAGWPASPRGHIPDLTITKLQVVSIYLFLLIATGVASLQGRLTLPDTWFRSPVGDLLMLQLLKPVYRTCLIFSIHFTLNTPRYFLDFALNYFIWLRNTDEGSLPEICTYCLYC